MLYIKRVNCSNRHVLTIGGGFTHAGDVLFEQKSAYCSGPALKPQKLTAVTVGRHGALKHAVKEARIFLQNIYKCPDEMPDFAAQSCEL